MLPTVFGYWSSYGQKYMVENMGQGVNIKGPDVTATLIVKDAWEGGKNDRALNNLTLQNEETSTVKG